MGYLHIENLYRPAAQTILLFRECYALEKVHGTPWRKVSTDLAVLDAERDRPSEVAVRRGIAEPREREGVVLRPLVEMTTSNGSRIIVKHKGDKFSERATPQKVVDPDKLVVLTAAQAIADEWVTPMRLEHVLQTLQASGIDISDMATTPKVIAAMLADVEREASGEVVMSRDAKTAIGRKTAELFKARMKALV